MFFWGRGKGGFHFYFFYTTGVFNLFLPKPIPHLQYRVCGGGSGIRVESSGYIFPLHWHQQKEQALWVFCFRISITAIIASASNHGSAGKGGGDVFFFFLFLSTWVLKSEEICFQQVWMGERKGKRGVRAGGRVLVFMHNVYDATYLHRPTCSILQSIDPVSFGYMYVGGGEWGVDWLLG